MSYGTNLNQSEAGRKSIGAIATAKVQTNALNLGFPSAYQSVYAAKDFPQRFFPMREFAPKVMWAGDDLQSQYHEQKRQDADFMAGAKVRATQLSRVRYVGTPHGRGLIPDTTLGQRIFANPSNGALLTASGRQNHKNSPFPYADGADYTSVFQGGVLRSAQGQAHGKAVLRARVGQLNDIEMAAADFSGVAPMPQSSGISTQSVAPRTDGSPAIELNLLLQSIQDACVSGTGEMAAGGSRLDKFDLATASRALGLIFRLAPESDSDFLLDLQAKIQNILELLNGSLDSEAESAGMTASARETALSLQTIFTRLDVYVKRMIGGAPVQRQETRFNPLTSRQETVNVLSQEQGENLSTPERVALSKNLVSSLGFSKMLKYAVDSDPSGLLSEAQRENLFTAQQRQRYMEGDMDSNDSAGDDDSDFDESGRPREDEQHDRETGVDRSNRGFSVDERQTFGFNSGMFFPRNGRGEDEYFGETDTVALPPQPPPSVVSDQRRGHRNRDSVAAPQSVTDRVSGRFDPDTQAFNLNVETAPPSRAPTRSTASREAELTRMVTGYNLRKRRRPARGVSASDSAFQAPTSQTQLPTTREGFVELARQLAAAGGPRIIVYAGSTVPNIRKNFIRRLGLAGRI